VDASCRICRNATGNRDFPARVMMLGLRDRFDYLECGRCGALQIREVPADLSRYYAPPYYSFQPARPAPPVKRWLRRRLASHALGRLDPLGALMTRLGAGAALLRGFRTAGVDRTARVLDVGAGAGQTLFMFRDYGFRDLSGVDPYLDTDVSYDNGVTVRRAGLEDVDGRYDLIMFHHSFEHVPDPAATLAAARDRLAPGGRILIRMPVAAESWRVYGPDWVELDAPRHLHVHTLASTRALAGRTGLELERVHHEAYDLELWGSEQYRRGIPLTDPRSHWAGGRGEVFDRREMRVFAARARELARSGEAGRAAFWLARVPGES
jgi:SAM-dependent methyltransferase